jgi:23S rRNA (pseudouridine1915-N3)-methyltransferase
MRVMIVAVGRVRAGPERTLVETYAKRLAWPFEIVEVREKKPLKGAALVAREAALLLEAVPPGAFIVALDEAGASLTSEDFARRLGGWRDQGRGCVAFLIGGADGHGPAVGERVDLVLGLGSMTWPHQLVRVLLVEQLYRASSILAGHPYHRG